MTDTRGSGERSGSHALRLLSSPLNAVILAQLFNGPMRLAELREGSGSAPQSTIRACLKKLQAEGLITVQSRKRLPGVDDFALTTAGGELLVVVGALEHWLSLSPDGPLAFHSAAGNSALKALEGGWSSTIMGALAEGSESLSSLARFINGISYPSLDRRLTALRRAGQVEACATTPQGTPYEVTTWLRQGVAPLAAAVRWESANVADETASMTRLDTEAAFLLALPLLQMAVGLNGSCRMEVDIDDGQGRLCGAVAVIEQGKVVSSTGSVTGPAGSWATGTTLTWGQAMIEAGPTQLTIGGNKALAQGLVEGLQVVLFGTDADEPANRDGSILSKIRLIPTAIRLV